MSRSVKLSVTVIFALVNESSFAMAAACSMHARKGEQKMLMRDRGYLYLGTRPEMFLAVS